jgi:lysyl endopeptidase
MYKKLLLVLMAAALLCTTDAQVKTNFNNDAPLNDQGLFARPYKNAINFELPSKNIKELLETERQESAGSSEGRPFKLAVPVAVDLNVVKLTDWTFDNTYAYGKYTIKLNGALSSSINFDQFYLPKGTEMYVYNEKGNMITGTITENENNADKIWGSWFYKGDILTIEIKTPIETKDQLLLHAGNVAYGYKEMYTAQVGNFGQSAACNINVLCALGNGWQNERNAVALILDANGSALCSGAMVMNTCNTSTPFFLTANHCFTTSPTGWRFTFQAWSATCTPSQNSNGVTFNGSNLRANSAASDFCLVELNNTPAANSGINYAGWNRNTAGITQTTIIHHPRGDVMKITRDDQAPAFANFSGAACWQLVVDNGTTEGGSSGAPYFDQNRRIIAQHFGINDNNLPVCQQVNKFGGRFDLSWTGGASNATRLSNWLDPSGSNVLTTNTTNIANLTGGLSITGSASICTANTQYTVAGFAAGTVVNWTSSNTGIATISATGNTVTLTPLGRGFVTITATAPVPAGCAAQTVSRVISVNAPVSISSSFQGGCNGAYQPWFLNATPSSNGSNWNWSVSFVGTNSQITIYTPSSPGTTVSVKGGGTVRLNYTDACGVARQDGVTLYSPCPQFRLSVSPNPAKNNLAVNLNAAEGDRPASKTEKTAPVRTIQSKGKTILSLFEVNTNLLVKQWKYNESKNLQYNLPVTELRKGIYILQVDRDNETQVTRIYIQ